VSVTRIVRHHCPILCATAAVLGWSCSADDDKASTSELLAGQVNQRIDVPVDVAATATAYGCQNSPGPVITLAGGLTFGGLTARLIFRNNVQGTHEHVEDVTLDTVAIPAGKTIQIPKQPSRGGSGGNPFIWVQVVDGAGNALTDELFLGRCVQGLLPPADLDAWLGALLTAHITTSDCSNNPGPYITMNGAVTLDGLALRIIFRNNDNPVGGPHMTVVTTHADVEIIPPGMSIQFNKQPVLGGVGGNPWIYWVLLDGAGNPLSGETLLGRCVQMSK
jgi:hypothetical protein